MDNQRNFFITIGLSVLILTLWQVFYMNPRIEHQRQAAQVEQQRAEQAKKQAEASAGQQGATGQSTANQSGAGQTAPNASVPGQSSQEKVAAN
ncbi:MAG: membrane protein insertase YidC, partial [Rhizobiales bacterium]|nr:membrane protein insertase YidC [Hyphomicrobiales bacterium]